MEVCSTACSSTLNSRPSSMAPTPVYGLVLSRPCTKSVVLLHSPSSVLLSIHGVVDGACSSALSSSCWVPSSLERPSRMQVSDNSWAVDSFSVGLLSKSVCVRNTNSCQDLVSPSPPLLDPSTSSKCLTLHTEAKSPPTATLSGSPEVSLQQVLSEVLSTSAETRLGSCPPGFNVCAQESSVSSFGSFPSHLDGFTSTTSKTQLSQLLPNGMDKATLRAHG
jgi:hypothetical protein